MLPRPFIWELPPGIQTRLRPTLESILGSKGSFASYRPYSQGKTCQLIFRSLSSSLLNNFALMPRKPNPINPCCRWGYVHLTTDWKSQYTIEHWVSVFSGTRIATFAGFLLSGFISSHHFMRLLSGIRFFHRVVSFGS